jgi:hypothetical protein
MERILGRTRVLHNSMLQTTILNMRSLPNVAAGSEKPANNPTYMR